MIKPERNMVSNMMPACAPCNLHKGGYSVDQWRDLLERSGHILSRDKSLFRAAVRFGKIVINDNPVRFYFETMEHPNDH